MYNFVSWILNCNDLFVVENWLLPQFKNRSFIADSPSLKLLFLLNNRQVINWPVPWEMRALGHDTQVMKQVSKRSNPETQLYSANIINFFSHLFSTDSDLHPATDSLMDFVYYHWSKHPFIRGGYSSPTAHAWGMRHALATPVDDHLFFAGEATSLVACATVHTAIETGLRAAREVSSCIQRVDSEMLS